MNTPKKLVWLSSSWPRMARLNGHEKESCSQGWWWVLPAAADPPPSSWALMNYIWIVSVVLNAAVLTTLLTLLFFHTQRRAILHLLLIVYFGKAIQFYILAKQYNSIFWQATTIFVVVSHNVQPCVCLRAGFDMHSCQEVYVIIICCPASVWLIKCDHYLLGRWLIKCK